MRTSKEKIISYPIKYLIYQTSLNYWRRKSVIRNKKLLSWELPAFSSSRKIIKYNKINNSWMNKKMRK